jgi:ferredoxin
MTVASPKEKPWGCSHCSKRFVDAFAVREHHKKKHKNKKLSQTVKDATRRDEEESFADRAIAAELDHAMGIGNPDYDWLVEPYK